MASGHIEHSNNQRPPSSAQTYLRSRAYSIVYGLHKSFTTSVLLQKSIKSVLEKEEDKSLILASLTFHGIRPQILPLTNWMVSNEVTVDEDGDNLNNLAKVEVIYTHPLPRNELQDLMSGLKAQEECPRPRIKLWLHSSIIMPHVSLQFEDIQNIPEMMVLPAQKGISVTFQCSEEAFITAYCIPKKFDRGQLTCRLASEVPSIAASRSKRSVLEANDLAEDFQKNIRDYS